MDGRYLEHFALDAELVARPYRPRPAELIEAEADDAAGGLEFAVDQQPYRQRGGVTSACRQAAKHGAARRRLVEVKGLRIELGGERDDLLLAEPPSPGAESLADGEVLEVRPSNSQPRTGSSGCARRPSISAARRCRSWSARCSCRAVTPKGEHDHE